MYKIPTNQAANTTATYLNGLLMLTEDDNSVEAEKAFKATLIATYGPVRLNARIVGGNGRMVMDYRTVGDR